MTPSLSTFQYKVAPARAGTSNLEDQVKSGERRRPLGGAFRYRTYQRGQLRGPHERVAVDVHRPEALDETRVAQGFKLLEHIPLPIAGLQGEPRRCGRMRPARQQGTKELGTRSDPEDRSHP